MTDLRGVCQTFPFHILSDSLEQSTDSIFQLAVLIGSACRAVLGDHCRTAKKAPPIPQALHLVRFNV